VTTLFIFFVLHENDFGGKLPRLNG